MTDNTQPQIDTDTIHTLALVELLLNPEYTKGWVDDLATELGVDLNEPQLDAVDSAVTRTLDQLAIPFVESLPEAQRAVYQRALKERERAAHPLGEGHGEDIEL